MEKNLDALKIQRSKQISQHSKGLKNDNNNKNCNSSVLQQNSSGCKALQEEEKSEDDDDDDNNDRVNNNNTNTILIVDNPCWGTPTECSMKHLLRYVTKESIILYESINYLIINKPPDLRMDGNYPATVLKLLLYWYPSPSLLLQTTNNIKDKYIDNKSNYINNTQSIHVDSNSNNNNVDCNTQLLDTLSTINNYSDVYDNEIRPCHQLDYATSGVLLVARNQNAANVARISFENRLVTKRYVALVHGHISQSTYITDAIQQHNTRNTSTTTFTTQQLTNQLSTIEKEYRKSRTKLKRKRNTFSGYLPPHSLFQQWQSQQQQQNRKVKLNDINTIQKLQPTDEKNNCTSTNQIDSIQIENSTTTTETTTETKTTKKRSNITILTNDDWKEVWDHLYQRIDNNMIQSLIGCTWNQMKIISNEKWPIVRESFQLAANTYNEILSNKIQLELSNNPLSLNRTTMGNIPMILTTIDNDDIDAENNSGSIDHIISSLNLDNSTTTTMNNIQSNTIQSFYIASPIAEPTNPNTFQMIVPESYVDPTRCPQLLTNKKSSIDKQQNNTDDASTVNDEHLDFDFDFKPSLTKCWILDESYIEQNENDGSGNDNSNNEEVNTNRIPVTYVILEPKTGRRHQLRVHTALIGHPIVGDQSYNRTNFIRSSFIDDSFINNNDSTKTIPIPTTTITRTCLHSLSLSIPVVDNDDNTNDDTNDDNGTTCRHRHLTVSSHSPFQSYQCNSGRKLLRISLF